MKVTFQSKHLLSCFETYRKGVREWGDVIARNYIKRITAIQAAATFDDLYRLPSLNFHSLSGDRAGQFAINLTGRARLILSHRPADKGDEAHILAVDPNHYGH